MTKHAIGFTPPDKANGSALVRSAVFLRHCHKAFPTEMGLPD